MNRQQPILPSLIERARELAPQHPDPVVLVCRAVVNMPVKPEDRARWLFEEVERLALAELSQPARVPTSGLRSDDGGSL